MTNLKVFQDKKELLKSLPALTASDFIVYDTSDQDETKPFVLVSFSFYNEKEASYTYQIRTETSLGNFITGVARQSGNSGNTGYYMYDVRTFYYDLPSQQWVLDVVNSRSNIANSSVGLRGSSKHIIYSTRDVYTSGLTIGYNKDSRFLLSGRFRNDTPFDEFFNESHLAQLGYETGDDLLRVKYADNNHLLYVIKGSTSPLKAIYSSTYYYNLTISGRFKGLQCKDGVYTETTNSQPAASKTLSFDDYVLYSTLDITFQDRLMRIKDHYVVGTRDEIISVSPESIQIKEPFEFEVQTNPTGLAVNALIELPEVYDTVGFEVEQFRAGNSYPYEHYFETIDLVGEWARQPLPPKEVVAQFYDGNNCRIVYQSGENECQMLTFTMEEDCHVYWGNSLYGYWHFSDKNKASNFMLYPLTKEGIGEGTSITWHNTSSSYNYLNTNVKTYKREADCIFFSNVPIYDSNKVDVLFEAMSYTDLAPYYFHLRSVGFDPSTRVQVGETWEELLQVDCNKSDETTIQSISFSGDYQPTYDKKGTYCLTAHIIVDQFEGEVFSSPFLLNIYDETSLSYPNNLPFPVEDGMKDFLVFKGKTQIGLMAHTGTEGIHLYVVSDTLFRWIDLHPDGGYGSCGGSYLYYLNEETKQWEFQSGSESYPFRIPTTQINPVNGANDVIYSTVDIYNNDRTKILYPKDERYPKKDYHISMRQYPVPYELPDVKPLLKEDGAIHYFISYRGGNIVLTTIIPTNLNDFAIIQKGSSSSTLRIDPSGSMSKVVYRRFYPSTGAWGSPVTETNRTSFNSSYVDTSIKSTLNGALTINDMVIYTTLPIYLKRSVGNQQTLLRYEDNRLIADENSIPPTVTDVSILNDPPFTVDTSFEFDMSYELESLDGLLFGGSEWENKLPYYPPGDNTARVRVKDSRKLWSEWAEKTFTVEPPITPSEIDIFNLPLKPDGSPYQHYLVALRIANRPPATNSFCFCFDLKEGVETFNAWVSTGSNNPVYFNDNIPTLFDNAYIYNEYSETTGWGKRGVLTPSNYKYIFSNGATYGIGDGLASNVYVSTFPIHTDNTCTAVRVYPINKPEFPLNLTVAASHENVWTSDDVTVTTKIVANGQSWRDFKYRINSGDFIPLQDEGDLIFTESGDYHLEFFVYNQDNVETKAEVSFKIDKDHPVLSIEETDTHLIFKAIDEHSGLAQLHYRLAENNVFTRSKNFANHLALVLSENGEATLHANDWISISSGFKLAKPTIGGTYTYELMGVDEVGNTHLIQHIYDLPKIPITDLIITPENISLAYNQSQQLTVDILPTNHNEDVQLSFESLSPYVSVSNTGVVKNINGYFEGIAEVCVRVNQKEVNVPITCEVNRLEYPSDYPNLYDLHNYTDRYTDFIIAKPHGSNIFRLYAFNRENNDAIYYIDAPTFLQKNLAYSVPNSVINCDRFDKLDERMWNRQGTRVSVNENGLVDSFYSKYPQECVVFSTVDIYSDASGELLAYPKQELPPTQRASVWFEPDYFGQWVNASYFTVHGEDRGDGLSRLTYAINGGEEILIEIGGMITFPSSGTHTLQAFAYNNHLVRSQTDLLTVHLDMDAPTLTVEKVYNEDTMCYDIYVLATDNVSTLSSLRYRKVGTEFNELHFKGEATARVKVDSHPLVDDGTFDYDFYVSDVAGNESYLHYLLEVEKPIPTGISVVPASISLREGESVTLSVEVEVIGNLESDEITLSGYDELIIDVNGLSVMGLTAGFTSIVVSCRGVSTVVPVTIKPAFIPVESLEVQPTEATMEVGDVLHLETFITPHEATDKTLTFAILQGNEVVSVDQEGVVVALKQGQAIITITTHNDIQKQVAITVPKPLERPVIQRVWTTPERVHVGERVKFNADVWVDTDRGAFLKALVWDRQASYSTPGKKTISVVATDNFGQQSERFYYTFEVHPVSHIKMKMNNEWKSLAVSNAPTPIRVKTNQGWVSLMTTHEPSSVRFKVGDEWINIQIEK